MTREWTVARLDGNGSWVKGETYASREEAENDVKAAGEGTVISREVMSWYRYVTYPNEPAYRGEVDELVAKIIAEENATLRSALAQGATIAVSHIDKPGPQRVAHHIGCSALEIVLNRNEAWETRYRKRLRDERTFRLSVPTLLSTAQAQRVEALRECRVCVPDLQGTENTPRRTLNAESLKTHHIGLVLCTEGGTSLGTIEKILSTKSATNPTRYGIDSVVVTTALGAYTYAGKDRVHVWNKQRPDALIERENQLRLRLELPPIA